MLCVFAVKRGEIENRLDVSFNLPQIIEKDVLYRVPLGELCIREPDYGVSAAAIERTDESQVKYIRITDFSDYGIEKEHIYTTVANFLPKHILNDGDILFARSGSIGRTFQYDRELGAAVFAGYCIRFTIDPKKALPEYVYWYTKTSRYANWVRRIKRPTVQANINKEEFKSLEVVLPPYSEQLRLASGIAAALKLRISKLNEANALLAGSDRFVLDKLKIDYSPALPNIGVAVELRTLQREKTFGAGYYHPERLAVINAIENDSAVSTRRLSEIVDFLRSTVRAGNDSKYLGLAGVARDTGELSGVEETADGLAFEYHAGDVLFSRLRPYLNKVLFAETDGICSTEFHVMRVNCADVMPEYLAAVLRSGIIVTQTRHMMTGNTHPRISNDDVKNLRVPIPAIAVQSEIVDELRFRIQDSRSIRREAEAEWALAVEWFERELTESR